MKKKRTSAKKKPKKEVNVNQIINDADTAMVGLDLERAYSQYTAASKILRGQIGVPQKILLSRVLGKLGEVKVSLSDHDGARDDFSAAISLLENEDDSVAMHESRANLYLYLGQVSSDQEALVSFRKGVEELEACIRLRGESCKQEDSMEKGSSEQDDALQETRRQQSAAYCSIAELYLTDLCYEEDAERECETAIQAALKIIDLTDGEPLVDSLQTMASLRLSQCRAQEAMRYVLEAYEKMKFGCEALSALVGLQKNEEERTQAVELVDVDAANNLPSFEFRCQSAKILLECAAALKEESNVASRHEQAVQCTDAAIQVLGSLLAENDEVIEVWHLMGCAFEAISDVDAASQYWERTLDMLLKVKESLEMSSNDDEEQGELQDINGQIEDVRKKLEEIGRGVEDMETEDVNMDS